MHSLEKHIGADSLTLTLTLTVDLLNPKINRLRHSVEYVPSIKSLLSGVFIFRTKIRTHIHTHRYSVTVIAISAPSYYVVGADNNKLCGRPPQYAPAPCKLTFDLLTLKVVSESRDVGYRYANFSLPRPLCSQLRPDVRDRQTDVRHASSLNAPYLKSGA